MGRQQQHQTKTTNSQAATSPALQKSAVDSISEFQEIFGSRAASRQFRSQQPDAQSLASPLSAKLGMPTIQAKPSFRGLSSELTAKDSQIQSPRQNQTGLPDNLRAGIENLSGISMADVKVHFNSTKPSELQALAYTQGTDIYLGSGQEKHLAHEGWHVVQQKQGRVQPTMQAKGKPMNSDRALEKEADIMGAKALQTASTETTIENSLSPLALPLQIPRFSTSNMPVQCLQDTREDKKKLYEEIQKQCKEEKIVLSMPLNGEAGHSSLYEIVKNKLNLTDNEWQKATVEKVASQYIAEVERNYPPSLKKLRETHSKLSEDIINKPQVNQILGEALANLATVQDSNQADSDDSEEHQGLNDFLTSERQEISKNISAGIEEKRGLQKPTQPDIANSEYQNILNQYRNSSDQDKEGLKDQLNTERQTYLDELYKQAAEANEELKSLTQYLAGETKGTAGFRDGLKDQGRAKEKVIEYENAKDKKDASSLVDIAGSRILYSSLEDLFNALSQIPKLIDNFNSEPPLNSNLEKPRAVEIVQIKNRFNPRQKSGYADILMNLKMSNGHIVEFRLELKQFVAVADIDHYLYEVVRSIQFNATQDNNRVLTPEESKLTTAIGKEAKKMYDKALDEALKKALP